MPTAQTNEPKDSVIPFVYSAFESHEDYSPNQVMVVLQKCEKKEALTAEDRVILTEYIRLAEEDIQERRDTLRELRDELNL